MDFIVNGILGTIIAGSVGISPAVIYRYVVYKAPIESKKVFLRLAPWVILLMFLFKGIIAGMNGTRASATILPWIVFYYVGKWIMTKR